MRVVVPFTEKSNIYATHFYRPADRVGFYQSKIQYSSIMLHLISDTASKKEHKHHPSPLPAPPFPRQRIFSELHVTCLRPETEPLFLCASDLEVSSRGAAPCDGGQTQRHRAECDTATDPVSTVLSSV